MFGALWLAGSLGLPLVGASLFFFTWVALLDVALVFLVFKGDGRFG